MRPYVFVKEIQVRNMHPGDVVRHPLDRGWMTVKAVNTVVSTAEISFEESPWPFVSGSLDLVDIQVEELPVPDRWVILPPSDDILPSRP